MDKLRDRECWDEKNVVEWADAKREHPDAHVASLFSIVGIQNGEQSAEHWKWKGRIVLGGHNVRSVAGEKIAMFQDTASSPSSMAAARSMVTCSCLTPDSIVLQSDCPNAYVQSYFEGPPTFIRLPKEWWPNNWSSMRDPVCRLVRNLYGHPTAGHGWQSHLEDKLMTIGFAKVENWQSVYYNKDTNVSMVVYVDDLLGAGPEKDLRTTFEKLSKLVDLDPPEPLNKYLGCHHTITHSGTGEDRCSEVRFDMTDYCRDACEQFVAETGQKLGKARSPFAPQLDADKIAELDVDPGKWGDLAAHFLMKLLYAARMCRPDMMVAITRLASRISKWTADCDRRLVRIYEYLQSHLELGLHGKIGCRNREEVFLRIWPDADLAGDHYSTKSTSGRYIELCCGDDVTMPIAWSSRKQGSTSSSTPEAEIVSMSVAVREDGIPLQQLFSELLGRPVRMVVMEDNEASITIVRKGYSPTLRYLSRVQRTSIGFLHEIFVEESLKDFGEALLMFAPTATHKGDQFTKELGPIEFERALELINMY